MKTMKLFESVNYNFLIVKIYHSLPGFATLLSKYLLVALPRRRIATVD